MGQLYGGKICAALDRQHPRDLFDVRFLLQSEGFADEIKRGFLFLLLSSNRPLHEILAPHLKDQRKALQNQFEGMSRLPFTYQDYEEARSLLVKTVREGLTSKDKNFLLSFVQLHPDWSIYDFEKFPAVQWKLQNLLKLREVNPAKHAVLLHSLEEVLF